MRLRRLFAIAPGHENAHSELPWINDALGRSGEPPDGFRSSIEVDDGGTSRFFLPRSVALKSADSRTIGWTLILVDVTAFRRLDQLKDSLLSMASHELKTPLTSMRLILPLLLEQTVGPLNEEQSELVTITRDATEHMRNIVETILDLRHFASGKMPIQPRSVQPADLGIESIESMRRAFAGKDVSLHVEIPEGLPLVRSDPSHLEHVFSNLLSNALRHTPAGGKVTVSARTRGDSVQFEVADSGCGIAPEHLTRVFETFYRARAAQR